MGSNIVKCSLGNFVQEAHSQILRGPYVSGLMSLTNYALNLIIKSRDSFIKSVIYPPSDVPKGLRRGYLF